VMMYIVCYIYDSILDLKFKNRKLSVKNTFILIMVKILSFSSSTI